MKKLTDFQVRALLRKAEKIADKITSARKELEANLISRNKAA